MPRPLPTLAPLLLLALAVACHGGVEGGSAAGGGAGGDGPGGTGGVAGGGGSGGDGGTSGAGGTGGGGTGGCPLPDLPCGSHEPVYVVAPALENTMRSYHGTGPFEATGRLVERGPDAFGRERLVFSVPGDDAPLVILVAAPSDVGPPFAPGDAVTVLYDSFSMNNPDLPFVTRVRLLDAEGRLRWALDAGENVDSLRLFEPEVATLAEVPVCRASPESDEVGFEREVSLRGGPAARVRTGVATAVAGGGAAGRFYQSVARQPLCPADGAVPSGEARGVLVIDEPEPAPAECRSDGECGPFAYCERGAGRCDGVGRCVPRPTGWCPYSMQPGCGCDGTAYASPCDAHVAGTDFSLVDDSACEGLFRCGWFSCPTDEMACLDRGPAGAEPEPTRCIRPGEEIPQRDGCDPDAVTCACFDLAGTACTCAEPARGEVRITCG